MTTWVNVTTSMAWSGVPFGIVRVESNIAHGLLDRLGPSRLRFCTWDPRQKAFTELPWRALLDRLQGQRLGGAPSALGSSAVGSAPATPVSGSRLRGGAPAVLRGHGTLARLWRRGTTLRNGAARYARSLLWDRVARRGTVVADARPVSAGCFARGDVLLTLGSEWEYGFMPVLHELKQTAGIHIVGCCHDVIPIKYPQLCLPYVVDLFPGYLRQLARSCDAIACVSEVSLRDLGTALSGMGEALPDLFTIRLGCTLPGAGGIDISSPVSALVEGPYVLFVSTIERRKNHEVLYRAFHRLAERHEPAALPTLVFVGSRGWGIDDLLRDIATDPRVQGRILLLHAVSDPELRALYQNALFCVFPSLYEGWGLPVAEALALGKPVLCSDRGSLREVGSDLVEYVDPWDLPGWVRAIERLWLDAAHRQRLADDIARAYRRPLWSETAATLARVALALEGT